MKSAKRELEKMGFTIEKQPKYRITVEEDEDVLIQVDSLKKFWLEMKDK